MATIRPMSDTHPSEPVGEPSPKLGDEWRPSRDVEPVRLGPLLPRRQNPHLLVEMDGSGSAYGALVWALREAARREATVVAVGVLDEPDEDPFGSAARSAGRAHAAAHDRLEAQLLRAIAETGVRGRSRCAVMSRVVLEALTAAGRGGDLVLVTGHGKSLLRQAVPRPPARRLARGA
jgi:nucleotide-binding universal stress UspA family protein